MRIRRKPLPFPTVLVTSPYVVFDPSPSKTDLIREERTKDNAPVKIEQVLHPQQVHVSSSTSLPPTQVWKKEEEKESVESSRNKGAQVNTVKRRSVTNNKSDQKQKQEEEKKAKQEKKKRRTSGSAVLMEGSRCSRVNGRGWRCSQPTLVGYSLCEHHLGKGRMRSMMINNEVQGQLGCTEPKIKSSDDELGVKNGNGKRKRNRVPTVKARSISSLLDERHVDDYGDEDYKLIVYMRNQPSE